VHAGKFGETSHEDPASGYRLRDRNGFRLSSVRYGVARLSKGRLEAWALRLRRHSGELIMVQPPASNPVSWHGTTILLLGMIVGVILWTPALPWLFKSLGFD